MCWVGEEPTTGPLKVGDELHVPDALGVGDTKGRNAAGFDATLRWADAGTTLVGAVHDKHPARTVQPRISATAERCM